MKELFLLPLSMLAGWIVLSIIMMWPPVCRYNGEAGNSCLNNLLQIAGAKEVYALESGRTNGPVGFAEVYAYMKQGSLRCNAGGTYKFGDIGQDPTCSVADGPAPRPQKERVGLLRWKWKVWPGSASGHRLPPHVGVSHR